MNKLTTEQFINKAIKVHGNKYDYKYSNYINSRSKLKIKCKIHGVFEQEANSHLKGIGCSKCSDKYKPTNKEFIEKVKKVHNNRYKYPKVKYINSYTKIIITCKTHGDFEQIPKSHLTGVGCPKCKAELTSINNRLIPVELSGLVTKIRGTIKNSFRSKKFTKKSRTFKILGCTWEEFRAHLEDNPYGFKVNQKGLDLDHIVPISSAKTEEEVIKLNHYTNFQLLPSDYNRGVKNAKIFSKIHFEDWLSN